MTTQRERYAVIHITRFLVFLIGMVGVVVCWYTQSFNYLLVFGAIERALWHWLPQLTRLELMLLDKWRNRL